MLLWTTLLVCVVGGVIGSPYSTLNTVDPTKQVIVEMFEWKYADVAKECEDFLSKYGFGAVQVSPAAEHLKMTQDNGNIPWWIKYQPASYKICSRNGDENDFKDMVDRCNKAGVRVIANVVTNHMTGMNQNGPAWCGSSFSAADHAESYPGVPYGPNDFNDNICDHDISNYDNAWEVRKCRLVSLLDINQDNEYPKQKIAEYLNSLIDIGVAGLRVDAAKHQYPKNLANIFGRLNDLNTGYFEGGQKPFIIQEVIDMKSGEAVHADDYVGSGRVTNFIYGQDVSSAVRRSNNFKYFGNFGEAWKMWNDGDVVVMIDDHDNQRGSGGNNPLTFKDSYSYTMAVTYMLAWPYGIPRVMSSYYFSYSDQGPPCCSNDQRPKAPYFRSDGTCDPNSGWVCEHRWPEVRRMSVFRSVTHGQPVGNIITDDNRIAFTRGNKGFFAVNNNGGATWSLRAQTGLPSGTFCDIISGEPTATGCTGTSVNVGSDGMAQINVGQGKTFALHVNARPGQPTLPPFNPTRSTPAGGGGSTETPPAGMAKTFIYLKKETQPGQNVFIRGGNEAGKAITASLITADLGSQCGADYKAAASSINSLSWAQPDDTLEGTPLYYTTNDNSNACYESMNAAMNLGPSFWKVEMNLDCSATNDGWFEFKGYMDGWEGDITQDASCTGTAGGTRPFVSKNHMARCGKVNVFQWGESGCQIDNMN